MSGYLIDASVWAEYLRGGKTAVRHRVEKLLDENRAAAAGAILAELLAGIRSEKEQKFLEECFLGLHFLETGRETFAAAGKMGAALRRKGITLPLSDLLIAALAKAHSLTILTMNTRFQPLTRPLGVQVEWLKGA